MGGRSCYFGFINTVGRTGYGHVVIIHEYLDISPGIAHLQVVQIGIHDLAIQGKNAIFHAGRKFGDHLSAFTENQFSFSILHAIDGSFDGKVFRPGCCSDEGDG